ncbi:MAG: nucleoside-diphosphate sugar epimerase/dehydratase [Acidimicrobiales bacterium]
MTDIDVSAQMAPPPASARSEHAKTAVGPMVARAASRVRADLPLVALDASLTMGCYFAALVLRFDGAVPPGYWGRFPALVALALVAHIGANWFFGLYRQMWRHASVAEARCVIAAGATATVGVWVASALTVRQPVSVLVLGGGAAIMFSGAVRFQSRLFAFQRREDETAGLRVVVVGAGKSGAMIVREMRHNPGAGMVPVAVLDDDERCHGRSLAGVAVLGPIDALVEVVARLGAHQVVLAIPDAGPELVDKVARLAEQAEVAVKLVPPVHELLAGNLSVRDVRDLRIEDLLGRAQVLTDLEAVRGLLRGRRVLITGAGGSIGSEIARQVAMCEPEQVVILDHDETHLFEAAATMSLEPVQVLADIRERSVLIKAFLRYRPQVVFHAAAHKHVPVLEDHPCEAVSTNVIGTANVLAAVKAAGVERLVFISTDKAVCPSSVMGASKWLGEQLVIKASEGGARHCAVRFGNVAGSRGSVIPTFARQIAAGGPVTVTDPEMTRYFMTVHEAVQLVLQATALAEGGEVFMLDMGEPVNILALAERMIRLSGRNVGADVAVQVTGRRPGEKLEESLRAPCEVAHPTAHRAIVRLHPPTLRRSSLDVGLHRLSALAAHGDDDRAARLLFALAHECLSDIAEIIDLAEIERRSGRRRHNTSSDSVHLARNPEGTRESRISG